MLTRRLRFLTRADVSYVNSYADLPRAYAHERFGKLLTPLLTPSFRRPYAVMCFDGPCTSFTLLEVVVAVVVVVVVVVVVAVVVVIVVVTLMLQ